MQADGPTVVQLDPKWCVYIVAIERGPPEYGWHLTPHYSLNSALKEFFDPLRTNNSRADFFSVYRKESDEFDREYTKKYDEDLNTSLIFVSYLISFLRAGTKSKILRPVCSRQSVQHLLSMYNPNLNPTRTT